MRIRATYYYCQIISYNLSQKFIHRSNLIFGFLSLSKLAFNCCVCGFYIASLMVVLHELIVINLEVVKHLLL
jgi:hypothetical protein